MQVVTLQGMWLVLSLLWLMAINRGTDWVIITPKTHSKIYYVIDSIGMRLNAYCWMKRNAMTCYSWYQDASRHRRSETAVRLLLNVKALILESYDVTQGAAALNRLISLIQEYSPTYSYFTIHFDVHAVLMQMIQPGQNGKHDFNITKLMESAAKGQQRSLCTRDPCLILEGPWAQSLYKKKQQIVSHANCWITTLSPNLRLRSWEILDLQWLLNSFWCMLFSFVSWFLVQQAEFVVKTQSSVRQSMF